MEENTTGIMEENISGMEENITGKGWFPYDRYDRCDRW